MIMCVGVVVVFCVNVLLGRVFVSVLVVVLVVVLVSSDWWCGLNCCVFIVWFCMWLLVVL